ncbi:MAG: hypothetical protein IKW08_03770 [Roseburia sp.]|nr:hypothetical protein [Roseburia sp.]
MKRKFAKNIKVMETNLFYMDSRLNENVQVHSISSACERQCIHCNVNSQKIGLVKR